MANAVFLEYTIHLRDRDEALEESTTDVRMNVPVNDANGVISDVGFWYTLALGTVGADGTVLASPERAAAHWNATIVGKHETIPSSGNYITSSWIHTSGQVNLMPLGLDRFDRKGSELQGLVYSGIFDPTYTCVWFAKFAYAASQEVPPTGTPGYGAIQRRRWVEGFEHPLNAGGTGISMQSCTLDASRHIGQLGLAMRSFSNMEIIHTQAEFVAGLTPNKTWERMYIRIRKLPSSAARFWRANCSLSASIGPSLSITPTGALAMFLTAAGSEALLGTSPNLTVNTWYRIDILHASGTDSMAKVYVNGILRITVDDFGTGSWGAGGSTHVQSIVGAETNTFNLGLDIDDWIGAEYPPLHASGPDIGTDDLTGLDWRNGSKVVPIETADVATSAVNWAGDPKWLKRIPGQTDIGTSNLTSSTPGATFEILTNATRAVEGEKKAIAAGPGLPPGAVAIVIGQYANRAGAGDGSLGYKLDGGAAVDTVVTQSTSLTHQKVMINPSGLTAPFAVAPLSLRSIKGAGATMASIRALMAQAELLGTFGPEDGGETPYAQAGVHSARYHYTESPYTRFGPPPLASVVLKGGTFNGNDTENILTFQQAPTWIFFRKVGAAGTIENSLWWSSQQSAIQQFAIAKKPDSPVRAELDYDLAPSDTAAVTEWRYRVRVIGDTVAANDVAAVYQYIAFCDPGMRFSQNGILNHDRTGGGSLVTNLPITAWGDGIEAVFLHRHQAQETPATTIETYFKGRGQTQVSSVGAVAEAALATVSGGAITSTTTLHFSGASGDEISYAAFKRNDGSSDAAYNQRIVRLGNYVGDGAASRTVGFSPVTGFRPMFALVTPRTAAAAIWRDPSHTGTTSTAVPSTPNASTGITAGGEDSMTVGSALNSNGVTYDYFVLIGDATVCNGGWGCNVEVILPPIIPPFWPPIPGIPTIPIEIPPYVPPGPGGPGPGPGPGSGPIDLTECPTESQKVCNQALSLIGVTSPIVDITEDLTPEAEQCRLHYEDCVAVVLKSHPWSWATGYAELELLEGSDDDPVNGDWTYSYRCPDGMIHPRRIVNPSTGRDYDPNPIKFRHGHDQSGTGLIYTDWDEDDSDNGTVELEYTYRPGCSALQGDVLFREALTWLLAGKLAPGLARNKVTAEDCMKMYEHFIARAKAMNATEQQQDNLTNDADWITGR